MVNAGLDHGLRALFFFMGGKTFWLELLVMLKLCCTVFVAAGLWLRGGAAVALGVELELVESSEMLGGCRDFTLNVGDV